MSDVRVVLPLRLKSEANERGHWAGKARRAKTHRTAAGLVLGPKAAALWHYDSVCGKPIATLPSLTVWITRIAPRSLDDDNLVSACKGVRDGVADALGIDDRDPRVSWHYGQRRAAQDELPKLGGSYGVEIVIARQNSTSRNLDRCQK